MPVTQEMRRLCYEYAKTIFPDKGKINEASETIQLQTGMNLDSARYYIQNFFSMLKSERMSYAMSESDTKYYFIQINKDFGIERLIDALFSLQRYLNFDPQNHPSLQALVDVFMNEYIFEKLKVGEIACLVLLPLLNSGCMPDDIMHKLQEEEYCERTFQLYIPLLKKYTGEKSYRYYSPRKKLVRWHDEEFLLTNDWYEDKTRHNLKPLCKWIYEFKYKLM